MKNLVCILLASVVLAWPAFAQFTEPRDEDESCETYEPDCIRDNDGDGRPDNPDEDQPDDGSGEDNGGNDGPI